MQAAVVSNRSAAPVLRVTEWRDPQIPDGWALVRLRRAALNRVDEMMLRARHDLPGPSILGADGAGVVVGLGAGASGPEVGAEVVISPSLHWGDSLDAPGAAYEILGSPTHGTHAEMVVVPAENLLPKPPRLSWEETAALPLAGVTAWRALVTRGRLQNGETVVIAAASSGVGSLAVQIASGLGARVIAVTSARKLEAAKSLGADHAVARESEDLADQLVRATDGGAHLALDSTGSLWPPLLEALRPGGRLVSVGKMVSDTAPVRVPTVFWKQLDILGSSMGSPDDFRLFLQHVEHSDWAPAVDSVHPLEDIAAAYERLDHPDRVGKVIIDVSPERGALGGISGSR